MVEKPTLHRTELSKDTRDAIAKLHDFLTFDYEPSKTYNREPRSAQEQNAAERDMCRVTNISALAMNLVYLKNILFANNQNAQRIVQEQIDKLNTICKPDLNRELISDLAFNREKAEKELKVEDRQIGGASALKTKEQMQQVMECIETVLDLI